MKKGILWWKVIGASVLGSLCACTVNPLNVLDHFSCESRDSPDWLNVGCDFSFFASPFEGD
jgi:hypothetical protein